MDELLSSAISFISPLKIVAILENSGLFLASPSQHSFMIPFVKAGHFNFVSGLIIGPLQTFSIKSYRLNPLNGNLRANISQRSMPKPNTSTLWLYFCPSMHSGAMYGMDPVFMVNLYKLVGLCFEKLGISLQRPKSKSFTSPLISKPIFSGLRSL